MELHAQRRFESLLRSLAQRLNGISALRVRLALHPGQGNTLHLRFALQNTQRVGCLDALNLSSIAGEENARLLLVRKSQYVWLAR